MRYSLSLFSIVFLLISFSCNNVKSGDSLAKVNDEFLYFDDVIYNIPKSIKDTNLFVEMYVEKWVREKVLLNQALINIDENSKEIEDMVLDYKNSLLIYQYQQELINQNFDTTVIHDDILSYYNEYINEFKLNQDIFKGRFIIIDKNAPNIKDLLSMFKSNNNDEIDDLIGYCMLYALEYYVNDTTWSYFNLVKQKLPNNIFPEKIFLSKRKYNIIEDKTYLYLLFLKDFKIKGTISPFSVEKEKIKSLLINNNKIEYLNMIAEDLINNGKSVNNIKIY